MKVFQRTIIFGYVLMIMVFRSVLAQTEILSLKRKIMELLSTIPEGQEKVLIDDMLLDVDQLKTFAKTNAAVWVNKPPWTDGKIYYIFDPELTAEGGPGWCLSSGVICFRQCKNHITMYNFM